MDDAHEADGDEHGQGVEAVEEGFVVGEGVVGPGSGGEFDEAVDDAELLGLAGDSAELEMETYGDEGERGVEGIQQPLPSLSQNDSASIQLYHLSMESNNQRREHQNEGLLESDAAHVNVDAQLHCAVLDVGAGQDQRSDELHEEGDDVGPDKVPRELGCSDVEDLLGGQVVVYHPAQKHVVESVDH